MTGSATTLNACMKKKSGVLRVLRKGKCKRGEKKLTPSKLGTIQQARAYPSAVQPTNDNTAQEMLLDSELFDTASMHDNVTDNSRLTAPIAGTLNAGSAGAMTFLAMTWVGPTS